MVFIHQFVPAFAQVPETVVKCYGILTQDPVINPTAPVTIQDQFGTETVDLNPPARICEEGLKHSTSPPANPRHWIQYEYTGSRDPGQIVVTDQFGEETVEPLFSFDLLVPAAKEGESPPNIQHWTDYLIAGTVDPPAVLVSDQFGTSLIDLGSPFVFSSTSTKNGVGNLNGPDMKCYNIESEDPLIDPLPHAFSDQFGTSTIDPTIADFLCVLAKKNSVPVVGGEILGIDMTTLFVAGVFANASWIVPVVGVTAAGIVGYILIRRRM
jgi:hypothetical protein